MACAEDTAGDVEWLRHRLRVNLGDDRWLENNYFRTGRDPFWYITLINLTDPLVDTSRFIGWFEANRDRSVGGEGFSQVDLCRWQFDGSRMMPEVVASVSSITTT